jgi:hypothetical protein
MSNLTLEERSLLAAFEKGELKSVENPSKNEMMGAARSTSKKDK